MVLSEKGNVMHFLLWSLTQKHSALDLKKVVVRISDYLNQVNSIKK